MSGRPVRTCPRPFFAALTLAMVGLASPVTAQSPQAYTKQSYAGEDYWLCLPTRIDACSANPGAVKLAADGKRTPLAWPRSAKTDTDCFYVYPTVNRSIIPSNSDPRHGDEGPIRKIAAEQVASLRRACRIYAPLYRQATIGAYVLPEDARRRLISVAAGDVLAAFDQYLARYNRGRRIVLIGHSQGSEMLIKLIQTRFDDNPALRAKLSIAVLAGIPLHVPVGATTGGEFSQTPICTQAKQRSCVVSFSTYAEDAEPKDDRRIPTPTGQERVCVNPAALDRQYPSTEQRRSARVLLRGTLTPPPGTGARSSEWAQTMTLVQHVYSGACVQGRFTRFYSIRDETGPNDARHQIIATTAGSSAANPSSGANDIGLHVADMQFPAHDLIALVEARVRR